MIKTENIHKSYGQTEVLKGIDLEIAEGEIVAIAGASGAGKTTLLQIMGTLSKQDQGSVIIGKTEINKLSDKKLSKFRNRNIGFVFQFHQLLPEFTALENVCMPGFIAKRPPEEVEGRAGELMSLLGIKQRMSHKPKELSGGEKQRVAIARALVNNPSIIFADEPTGNLDSQNTLELYELIIDLRKRFGQTFVIVTHNEELAQKADRMLTIKDGKILN